MNRRLYNNQSFVLTAIYRVFAIYNFHQKTLTETYCSKNYLFIELYPVELNQLGFSIFYLQKITS
jgi:hypothetical protein